MTDRCPRTKLPSLTHIKSFLQQNNLLTSYHLQPHQGEPESQPPNSARPRLFQPAFTPAMHHTGFGQKPRAAGKCNLPHLARVRAPRSACSLLLPNRSGAYGGWMGGRRRAWGQGQGAQGSDGQLGVAQPSRPGLSLTTVSASPATKAATGGAMELSTAAEERGRSMRSDPLSTGTAGEKERKTERGERLEADPGTRWQLRPLQAQLLAPPIREEARPCWVRIALLPSSGSRLQGRASCLHGILARAFSPQNA